MDLFGHILYSFSECIKQATFLKICYDFRTVPKTSELPHCLELYTQSLMQEEQTNILHAYQYFWY